MRPASSLPSSAARLAIALAAFAALASGCKSADPPAPAGVRIVAAPVEGDVAQAAVAATWTASAARRTLLVYVGATWCEPCRRFHRAVESGELGAALPGLTLLEFDLDRDRDRLFAAGYTPRYIPLFALPDAAGRGQPARWVEGSVKGEGAVAEIVPKLKALLASAR